MDVTHSTPVWRRTTLHLGILALLSVGIHTLIIARGELTARDSIRYIRLAVQLESPPLGSTRVDVLRDAHDAPGYPALVSLTSIPVRYLSGQGLTQDVMTRSCQIASAMAALILILPMYLLGLRLFDPLTAFLTAGLFQWLPLFAEISSDGVADSSYLLCLAFGLWLGVRTLEQPSMGRFLLCGLMIGLSYLVRPEGLVLLPPIALMGLGLGLRHHWGIAPILVRGGALVVGVVLVAGPYAMTIGGISNKPSWDLKPADDLNQHTTTSTTTLLAVWAKESDEAQQSRMLWAAQAFVKEIAKSSHYGIGGFMLIGLVTLSRRWRHEVGLGLLVLLLAIYSMMVWVMAARVGYLSGRHTLAMVMVGSFFVIPGLRVVGTWVSTWALFQRGNSRFWKGSLLLLLLGSMLPATLGTTLHADRVGHREVGHYLRANAHEGDLIWDPFCWSEFLARRDWGTDPDYSRYADDATIYVIIEERDGNRYRPGSYVPMYDQALHMAQAGRPVFQWPEGTNPRAKRLVVYRIDR